MRFYLRSILIILLFIYLPLSGQVEEAEKAPTIAKIKVEYSEIKNVSRDVVLAHIQIREGSVYDQNLMDRSIRSLYATRLFDYIDAKTERAEDGRINVIITVKSKYRIQQIEFRGNKVYSDLRLASKIELDRGLKLDERFIKKDLDTLRDYYRDKGYTNVVIESRVEKDKTTGLGTVIFEIDEGPKIKIADIDFVGNEVFSDRTLRSEIETKEHVRWWSWLTGSGRFDEKKFQEDLDLIRAFYRNEGFLDVSIEESDVRLEYPTPKKIKLTLTVDEGRQYKVGNISIEGNEVFSKRVIATRLRMIPGDIFSPEKLSKDIQVIKDIYGMQGYLDVRVNVKRKSNVETGNIDLEYAVTEGDSFYVESINIDGNTKTKSIVVLRELALTPGRIFNEVWMRNSELRLKNTRFFDEVHLTSEPTNIPGRRDLKVSVREGRTGQFQFGAGFSTLENVTFFMELSQANFDLFNHRSFFQGDGQKFRFRASVGSSTSELILSLEEPWYQQQRLSIGGEIYRKTNDLRDDFDETRTGFTLFARKRLFELVNGTLSYTLENVDVDLQGSAADLPKAIAEYGGERLVSKIGLNLVRDTRDNVVFTTRGSRYSFGVDWAGVGGDVDYLKFETRNAMFIPLFETGDQVLSILFRAGSYWAYDEGDMLYFDENGDPVPDDSGDSVIVDTLTENGIPVFDRFYLGGPNSLRGFEYQDVSPGSGGYYIGGNAYAFTSFEYTIKLAGALRFAMFYDWGFVNEDDFDFSPADYNDNWGIGIRLEVLGNPLRLDYGIPITTTDATYDEDGFLERPGNDEGNQFNFSFGTRF